MAFTIQIRRDTAANWTGTNPTLLQGEQGLETDTGKVKIGDGSTAWNSLAYNSDGVDWTGANTNFSTTGSIDATSALFDGSSDQVQVTVQGHSTQTNEIFVVENSAGTDLFSVNNSGNVTVAGTVDGRDLATDGVKLDGIEAGATADQTGSEIKTLYEAESDTNAYTDAEKSKLAGIEAGADVTDGTNVVAALADVAAFELGSDLTGDRTNYIDLHSDDVNPVFSARIIRNAGQTGTLDFNNSGGGAVNFVYGASTIFSLSNANAISYRPTIIDGQTDNIQLKVQGNAVQTSDIFVVEDSTGTDLLTVDSTGRLDVAGFSFSAATYTANNSLRLFKSSDITFIQCGTASSDVDANIVICRRDTTATAIKTFNVYANTSTLFGATVVDGQSDNIQLKVQGNAVQTADIFVVENSAGTDLFTVNNSGNTAITGTITAAGLPSGATAAAAGAATNELWVTSGHATLPDGVVMRA